MIIWFPLGLLVELKLDGQMPILHTEFLGSCILLDLELENYKF